MDTIPLILLICGIFCICGILFLFIPTGYHGPLAMNVTHINESICRYTWLGGIDYNSFVRDISVDTVSVGHPDPGTVIHIGNCSSVVKMYFEDIHSYRELWPKAEAT
jgi:hypothetical protein